MNMEENTLFPGRPNYVGPIHGVFAMLHHSILFEGSHNVLERIEYIKNNKPSNEVNIRLHNIMYLGNCDAKGLDAYYKAQDAYYKARDACDKARDAFYKARDACDKAWDACDKARDACDKARDACDKAWDAYYKAWDAYYKAWDACDKAQ